MNLLSEPGDIFDQLLKFAFSDVQLEKRQRQFAEKSASYCEDVHNMGQKRGKKKNQTTPFTSSVCNFTDNFNFFFF